MEVMRLNGGIIMYGLEGRYIDETPPLGRKVKFLNCHGYDSDLEYANEYFAEGDILTIKEIYVGRSFSDVEFVELPGKRFNTVMFQDTDRNPCGMGRAYCRRLQRRRCGRFLQNYKGGL